MLLASFKPQGNRWVGRVYSDGRMVMVARGSERYVRLASETFCAVWTAWPDAEPAAASVPRRKPPRLQL